MDGGYFLSQKQMSEARRVEMVARARLKRGEIKNYNMYKCGCGCGVFAVDR